MASKPSFLNVDFVDILLLFLKQLIFTSVTYVSTILMKCYGLHIPAIIQKFISTKVLKFLNIFIM